MANQREARASKERQRKRETESRSTEAALTSKSSTAVANDKKDLMLEDDAKAWQACREQGTAWGCRGKGGRGEYAATVNSVKSNIHLSGGHLTNPEAELLQNATIDIMRGHRYGLIGRSGCGKSTLLQRLASKTIPGMPMDMRILLVQQQIDGSDDSAV